MASWIIHDDPYSKNKTVHANRTASTTEVAFDSLMKLNLGLAININATKHVSVAINSLSLNGFNVTKDYIGGGVKSDEEGIYFRLSSAMIFV